MFTAVLRGKAPTSAFSVFTSCAVLTRALVPCALLPRARAVVRTLALSDVRKLVGPSVLTAEKELALLARVNKEKFAAVAVDGGKLCGVECGGRTEGKPAGVRRPSTSSIRRVGG